MRDLLEKLNLPYKDESLYEMAITHSSYAYENQTGKNEKLEFLGDAVIELLMSDYLYKEDLADEGEMTKKRAKAVCEDALVMYANKISLADYIKLGRGESLKGPNKAMIADAFEALFAAIYLDLGLEEARRVFYSIAVPHFPNVWKAKDYKSSLQELIQSGDKRVISYHTIKEMGPSHNREFEAAVMLDNYITLGVGRGKTKKEAEQNAAHEALKKGNYDSKENV
ncbi:MAG: ribonuclease III [Firmicutes bacterium]|nr:ribonuclease III [Bacillota bacterium]